MILQNTKSIYGIDYINTMKGKVAIITASSTGLGKGVAESLAREGVKVVISSRDQRKLDQVVQGLKAKGYEAHGVVCHLGKTADRQRLIKQTLQKYGKIDFLVPTAAVSTHMGSYLEASNAQIEKMPDLNYKSNFYLIQQTLPYLQKQKGGSIVILADNAAYPSSTVIGHSSLTKDALVAMTQILASQLVQDRIRVNCVCAGLGKTKYSNSQWSQTSTKSTANQEDPSLEVAEDVGRVVKFFVSDAAKYLTGKSLQAQIKPVARL